MTIEINKSWTYEKAPTSDSKGLIAKLSNYQPATCESLADDAVLNQLYDLEHFLDQPIGLNSKLLYLHDNISITNGRNIGEIMSTKDMIGLVLIDNQGQPASLACFTPNSDSKPLITDVSQPCAFVIGDISHDRQLWAVDTLEDGINLYHQLNIISMQPATILVNLITWQFEPMVKHFAEVQTVYLNVTVDKKHKLDKLAGKNVKAVITTFDMLIELQAGKLLDDIIAEATIIDMQDAGWGKLGDIADADIKATPYPVEAWGNEGEILRDTLEAITYYAQIPVALAGQCILGALVTIIQQYINAPYSDGDAYMPVSLFLLTEIESGGGKSKTTSMYSHRELIKYQEEKRKEYRTLHNEWKAQKASTPKKDLELWLLDNPEPKPSMLFAKSGTLIGFLDNMLMGNTRNVAWATAEAAQFLGSHSLTSESASNNISQICDIWSGGSFDRVLSPRYNTIDMAGMSGVRFTLDLQGQPPVIAPALKNESMEGQGLLPRFLFAFPDSLNGTLVFNTDERLDAKPEKDPRLIAYWQACRALLNPVASNVKTDSEGNIIRYNMPFKNRQARKVLADYQTLKESELGTGGKLEKYAVYAKRLHENASRIASILAYFEGRLFISADDIKRATLLTDYSMNERIRYTDKPQAGGNDAQKLIGSLVRYCNRNSIKELTYAKAQSIVSPKHIRSKNNFELLTELLEVEGYIKITINGGARFIQVRPELLEEN